MKDITLRMDGFVKVLTDVSVMCSCGVVIEPVPNAPTPGKYWHKVGTGEVAVGNHWHSPVSLSVGYSVTPK